MASKVTIKKGDGTVIVSEYEDTHDSVPVSYSGESAFLTIAQNETKTLLTNGKYGRENLVIGDKTLTTKDKIIPYNIVVSVKPSVIDEIIFNRFTISPSVVTIRVDKGR